jgi:hypothetical protein
MRQKLQGCQRKSTPVLAMTVQFKDFVMKTAQ